MNVKKVLALLLSLCMALSLAACGGGGGGDAASGGDSGAKPAGEVSIFYYTFNDTYVSSVRSSMDSALSAAVLSVPIHRRKRRSPPPGFTSTTTMATTFRPPRPTPLIPPSPKARPSSP